jgi:NAD(P)H-hydrate epimerase
MIIDALFGVGFHGELPRAEAQAVSMANSSHALRVAVDIPSGIEADTGRLSAVCFDAEHTVTMEYIKRGMLLYPAREKVGRIHVCSIGVDRETVESRFSFPDRTVDAELIRRYVLSRPADSHKGTYGRLMLVCGSDRMTGAAVLACEGALRMGVGLCELVCTERVAQTVSMRCPEVVFRIVPDVDEWDNGVYEKLLLESVDADAVVIGCGLGVHKNVRKLVELLSSLVGCPLLLDADGINSLDGDTTLLENAKRDVMITPHPKEFARLVYRDIESVIMERYKSAHDLAKKCGVTVLLKGAATIIASPDGTSYINTTGNSGLAKGGSGDVLSGMIGALLAQGIPTVESAALGAHVHGAAADLLRGELGETGMLPRDIPSAAARYLASMQ